jgi:hypothetical protein
MISSNTRAAISSSGDNTSDYYNFEDQTHIGHPNRDPKPIIADDQYLMDSIIKINFRMRYTHALDSTRVVTDEKRASILH